MRPRHLTRIALLTVSKRLGSARAREHRSVVFRYIHRDSRSICGASQFRQETIALGARLANVNNNFVL